MIRQAQARDIPRLAEIIVFGKRAAYRSIFRDDRFSFNELQVVGLARELEAQPDRLKGMLVWDDGIVKGVIGGTDFGQDTELSDFYVEPFFKGMGIGKELIRALTARARERGQRRIFLWVLKDNLSARFFYEAEGFRADGRERFVEGTRVLDQYYEKLL